MHVLCAGATAWRARPRAALSAPTLSPIPINTTVNVNVVCRGHCLARAAAGDADRAVTAAVLGNALGYYVQFRARVADAAAAGLAPLEKQLQVRFMLMGLLCMSCADRCKVI